MDEKQREEQKQKLLDQIRKLKKEYLEDMAIINEKLKKRE